MFRLQGTDGVRKLVAHSSREDLAGLTPQQAFLDKGVITEQFMELYTFARATQLVETGAANKGDTLVIGWDPRDLDGTYTSAAVSGISKGGLTPAILAVAPTPLVALYARHVNAAGAVMITASHNPAAYNGIKIFTRHGLKLLPPDDVELTRRVIGANYNEDVINAPMKFEATQNADKAWDIYMQYQLDPSNSWGANEEILGNVTLVVDAANGAMSPGVERILKRAGFGRVMVANHRLDGGVNENCGVTEFEGVSHITSEMLKPGGRFHENLVVAAVFELGRGAPQERVWGGVFDGDGDRLYMLIYDSLRDSARVLTGDETAALQGWFLKGYGKGRIFVNTVESDLNVALAAKRMEYKTELTAVGDKWILIKAAEELIRRMDNSEIVKRFEKHASDGTLGADLLEETLKEANADFSKVTPPVFIGAEESGHCITTGFFECGGPDTSPVFIGDGLKSLLNTSVVLSSFMPGAPLDIHEPGFKKTLYVYHVDKAKWRREGDTWSDAQKIVNAWAKKQEPQIGQAEMVRPEEPDMLYIKFTEEGAHTASVFIRSSGTEDKTGVSLRGPLRLGDPMLELAEELIRMLMKSLKNETSAMGSAELELLRKTDSDMAPEQPVAGLDSREYFRLLREARIQGLVSTAHAGATLTPRGEWLLSCFEEEE